MNIVKGSRIRARWLISREVSLAGMQMKFEATEVLVTGICCHFRGDNPTLPSTIRIYVTPDPGTWFGPTVRPFGCTCILEHVEIDPNHVIEVL